MTRRRKSDQILLKSQHIAGFLAKAKITRKGLAEKANINEKTLSNYFRRTSSVPEDVLGRIAEVLGAEPWDIAEGIEPIGILGQTAEESMRCLYAVPGPELSEEAMMINEFLQKYPEDVKCLYNMAKVLQTLNNIPGDKRALTNMLGALAERLKGEKDKN